MWHMRYIILIVHVIYHEQELFCILFDIKFTLYIFDKFLIKLAIQLMKNLLSFVVVMFVVFGVYGQDQEVKTIDRKYVVKFQPLNYALQSYSFEVERMLNGKNAVTLGFGIPNNGSLIGKYGITASPDNLSALELSTMHIRAAYRHYSGHSGLPRGFYIEPYLKYQQFKANATVNVGDNGITTPAGIKADFNTLNAGFQMGVQFLIAKRVALDFYFLGIEAGMMNGNLTGTPSQSDPVKVADLRQKIEDGIKDVPSFFRDKLTVTNNATSVNVKASSIPYPWIRGGFNIGIAF
jgi:hypothetical protein